jgi:hypothetical protein
MTPLMGGYVTWMGVAGLAILALVDFINNDIDAGTRKIVEIVALVGIGRKIEKSK